MRRTLRNAVYWIVAATGAWALVMFLTWDFRVLTGMTIADIPKSKRPAHSVAAGLTTEELLLHLGLIALWFFAYRWWKRKGSSVGDRQSCFGGMAHRLRRRRHECIRRLQEPDK